MPRPEILVPASRCVVIAFGPFGPLGRLGRHARLALLGALAFIAFAAPARAATDDDPKPAAPSPARPAGPPPGAVVVPQVISYIVPYVDEDDPKLDHSAAAIARIPTGPEHETPSVKLSYRYLQMNNLNYLQQGSLDPKNLSFHVAQLDIYAISVRYFRLGFEAEVGSGSGLLEGKSNSAWYFQAGLTAGFQYPGRITPFVESRFISGLMGGQVSGNASVTWVFLGGLEAGIEAYVAGRFFLSGALGWAHPVYHGFDFVYSLAHPTSDLEYVNIASDTFTLKIGLGF